MADETTKVAPNRDLAEEGRGFAVDVDSWSESLERLAEYDRTGASVDAAEALHRFREAVASSFRRKA